MSQVDKQMWHQIHRIAVVGEPSQCQEILSTWLIEPLNIIKCNVIRKPYKHTYEGQEEFFPPMKIFDLILLT